MVSWIKKLIRRIFFFKTNQSNTDVIQNFVLLEALKSNQTVVCNVRDDGLVDVEYSGGKTRTGVIDDSGQFHEV